MGRIGIGELVVIAVILILVFGAGRVADIGKGLGDGFRNLKRGLRDDPSPGPQDPKQVTHGGDRGQKSS